MPALSGAEGSKGNGGEGGYSSSSATPAGVGMPRRPDDPLVLQHVHQPRRPRVADAQPALEHGGTDALVLARQVDRRGQHRVVVTVRLLGAQLPLGLLQQAVEDLAVDVLEAVL